MDIASYVLLVMCLIQAKVIPVLPLLLAASLIATLIFVKLNLQFVLDREIP